MKLFIAVKIFFFSFPCKIELLKFISTETNYHRSCILQNHRSMSVFLAWLDIQWREPLSYISNTAGFESLIQPRIRQVEKNKVQKLNI